MPFESAKFDFLAANVVDSASGRTLLPAYGVKSFKGIHVALISMTLKGMPGGTAGRKPTSVGRFHSSIPALFLTAASGVAMCRKCVRWVM